VRDNFNLLFGHKRKAIRSTQKGIALTPDPNCCLLGLSRSRSPRCFILRYLERFSQSSKVQPLTTWTFCPILFLLAFYPNFLFGILKYGILQPPMSPCFTLFFFSTNVFIYSVFFLFFSLHPSHFMFVFTFLIKRTGSVFLVQKAFLSVFVFY